ncbi:MAG: cadherin repeat domain-containing protein, partial [Anaerolineales bacterium]|nr:cadherin repeat domain-containing protein [Anaerolineales bacterium]
MEKRYQRLLSGVLPFLLALGIMVVWVQYAETATISKINNTSGQADGSFITRTVTFDTADFSAGAQIESTTIAVRFEKIDGNSCAAGHQGGSAFNGEIYMYLESPAGTQVPLVNDINDHAVPAGPTTYNNTAYAGEVTVTFDDLAGTKASGLPTTGTFRPEGTLASFNGEDPTMGNGEWILYIGDAVTNDALCFKSFTLTVNASQSPTVDDQTFSVDESAAIGSSVGTVVATDNDPGEKLNFEIIASDPTADFDIDQLTGELTVANALDFETTPVYTLTVRVTDSTGLFDEATITINVNFVNIAPELANVANTSPIVENGVVTVTGDIVDLNGGDTFTLTVDWGDGNTDTYNYSAGTTDFSETHQYLDDDTDDMYTVVLTLDDSGGSQATAETTVTVSNEAPVVSNVNVSAGSIDEGDSVTLTGDIADVGTLDTFTLQVQWGDGTTDNYNYAAGTTNFSESHTYADDNPTGTAFDTNTIVVTLTDDDTGSDS